MTVVEAYMEGLKHAVRIMNSGIEKGLSTEESLRILNELVADDKKEEVSK